jgi:mono/diheme cytochrome c family protein
MKRSSRPIMAALGALLLGLTGCSHDQFPAYSLSLKYPLRQDPIIMQPGAKLGDERYDPDTPAQLPLMNINGIFVEKNPYRAAVMAALAPKVVSKLMAETDPKLMEKTDPSAEELATQKKLREKIEQEVAQNPAKYHKYFSDAGLDGTLRDPTKLSAKEKAELDAALEGIFGTPAKPTVNVGLEPETIKVLQIDDDTLEKGSTRYRVHCLHCHGVAGDGRGPTARWINPHPRDFRSGLFKFQSVNQLDSKPNAPVAHANGPRKPARADLVRTLRNGLEGTAMPSFALLDDKELEWIASYVIHLSIRGQVEMDLLKGYFSYDAKKDTLSFTVEEEGPQTITEAVQALTKQVAEKSYSAGRDAGKDYSWLFSQKPELAIKPEPYPAEYDKAPAALAASILRGKYLFTGDEKNFPGAKNANCVSCHVDFGRQAKFRFDDWGTLVRPNNFTAGTFRGGRRPVDMYYRVHSGINGSGMANFGSVLKGKEIWDLINFVSAMPYPAMQKEVGINAN